MKQLTKDLTIVNNRMVVDGSNVASPVYFDLICMINYVKQECSLQKWQFILEKMYVVYIYNVHENVNYSTEIAELIQQKLEEHSLWLMKNIPNLYFR